jgi:hypothetical protein
MVTLIEIVEERQQISFSILGGLGSKPSMNDFQIWALKLGWSLG